MTTEGLAIDWVTEHVYWVESTLDQIEVSDFSGDRRLTVVSKDLGSPRGITLDPNHGLVVVLQTTGLLLLRLSLFCYGCCCCYGCYDCCCGCGFNIGQIMQTTLIASVVDCC